MFLGVIDVNPIYISMRNNLRKLGKPGTQSNYLKDIFSLSFLTLFLLPGINSNLSFFSLLFPYLSYFSYHMTLVDNFILWKILPFAFAGGIALLNLYFEHQYATKINQQIKILENTKKHELNKNSTKKLTGIQASLPTLHKHQRNCTLAAYFTLDCLMLIKLLQASTFALSIQIPFYLSWIIPCIAITIAIFYTRMRRCKLIEMQNKKEDLIKKLKEITHENNITTKSIKNNKNPSKTSILLGLLCIGACATLIYIGFRFTNLINILPYTFTPSALFILALTLSIVSYFIIANNSLQNFCKACIASISAGYALFILSTNELSNLLDIPTHLTSNNLWFQILLSASITLLTQYGLIQFKTSQVDKTIHKLMPKDPTSLTTVPAKAPAPAAAQAPAPAAAAAPIPEVATDPILEVAPAAEIKI